MSPEPGADNKLEAIVLVRDGLRPEVVYPFSFVDIATAQTFIRYEMKRGIDPNHVMVYWAVPVQLGITNEGALRLFPVHPPAVDPSDSSECVTTDGPSDFMASVTTTDGSRRIVTLDSDEIFVASADDPIEALFATLNTSSIEQESAEPTLSTEEEPAAEEDSEDAKEPPMLAEEESDSDEPVEGNEEAMATAYDVANEVNGSEDSARKTPGQARDVRPAAHQQGTRIEFRTGKAPDKREDTRVEPAQELPAPEQPGHELRRVLNVRRWEEHTEPFTGFQSPPGRF
jgi:hypothetical protein